MIDFMTLVITIACIERKRASEDILGDMDYSYFKAGELVFNILNAIAV